MQHESNDRSIIQASPTRLLMATLAKGREHVVSVNPQILMPEVRRFYFVLPSTRNFVIAACTTGNCQSLPRNERIPISLFPPDPVRFLLVDEALVTPQPVGLDISGATDFLPTHAGILQD